MPADIVDYGIWAEISIIKDIKPFKRTNENQFAT